MEEDWEFVAASGERMEVHLTYERAPARKGGSEVKFFSPTNPSSYQIFKIEQGIDIMRNATVPVRDRVKDVFVQGRGWPARAVVRRNGARRQHRLLSIGTIAASICRELDRGDIRAQDRLQRIVEGRRKRTTEPSAARPRKS